MKPSKAKLQTIEALYTASLLKHGPVPLGLGWKEGADHYLRFRKLVACFDLENPSTVNDLGCGYGSFYDFLASEGVVVSHYRGVDISEGMIREATAKLSGPNIEFAVSSSLNVIADFSVASGIFNVKNENTDNVWRDHVVQTLHHLNSVSARGFSFNALTSYVDWKENHLFYADPLYFFDFCKRTFSRRVSLLHDYPLWEWTIAIVKE